MRQNSTVTFGNRKLIWAAIQSSLLLSVPVWATAQTASFDLNQLDGSNGFSIQGLNFSDRLGEALSSAGDINGDGFDDIIISAPSANPNGNELAGQSFVIFGNNSQVLANFNLDELDGSNGFVINGLSSRDVLGRSVSTAGDLNNDGIDDLVIGAPGVGSGPFGDFGRSYIIFGQSNGFSPIFDLSSLDGSNGFFMTGSDTFHSLGQSVAGVGDVNGDGVDDVLIGAYSVSINNRVFAGQSYVIFGRNGNFPQGITREDLDGTNGFILNGVNSNDWSGYSVSSAGDINGDGINDLMIGAPLADPEGKNGAGTTYVLFGSNKGFPATLELSEINGNNGFVINGINAIDNLGLSISFAGDVNGDGMDDIILGADNRNANGNTVSSGESYILFGNNIGFPASIELTSLNGDNGFVITGTNSGSFSPDTNVSNAGDVNNDGIDDLLIGAPNVRIGISEVSGEAYIVYGQAQRPSALLELSTLSARNGFTIPGKDFGNRLGTSVSAAGDFNNDGFDDILISAPSARANGLSSAGESYIIFGSGSLGQAFAIPSLSQWATMLLGGLLAFFGANTIYSQRKRKSSLYNLLNRHLSMVKR